MRATIATLLAVMWVLDPLSFAGGDPCAATPISGYQSILFTLDITDSAFPTCSTIHNDLWYLWTAPSTENVAITLCGITGFSPVVEVYDDTGCPGGSVACSNGTCAASFPATIGTNYQIRIGSSDNPTPPLSGAFTIQQQYVQFCAPGVGGIVTCPCGNQQVPPGAMKGCDNLWPSGTGTGGAILTASGAARIPPDTLLLSMTNGLPNHFAILLQSTANGANNRYGAGVRCIAGLFKRLYAGSIDGVGSINFTNVHVQSMVRGYTIVPPITLYYFCAYRNPEANGQLGCPSLTFGFNSTNAVAVLWTP